MATAIDGAVAKLRDLLGDRLSTGSSVRELHARDEAYTTPALPDAVAFPESAEEVAAIARIELRLAVQKQFTPLHLEVLDHRLKHEFTSREVAEMGGMADPGDGCVGLGGLEPTLVDRPLQPRDDLGDDCGRAFLGSRADDDLETGRSDDFDDAGTHDARADHSDSGET